MDRGRKAFPISSPLIFEWDIENRFKIHRHRLQTAKHVIDTAPPEDYAHFHYNAKRCMQQAERLWDIERANRILLEKMTKYAEYNGGQHFRPWSCRSTVNYAPGMVFSKITQGLHIDNLNIPANPGTVAGGNRKTDYARRQELQQFAKENMRLQQKIKVSKPWITKQQLEHEYIENVSRIDRLSAYRGPKRWSHRASSVRSNLEVAKAMRDSKFLPGTAGYEKDLSKEKTRVSISRQSGTSSYRQSDIPTPLSSTPGRPRSAAGQLLAHKGIPLAPPARPASSPLSSRSPKAPPPRVQSAGAPAGPDGDRMSIPGAGLIEYVKEANRSMKRAETFTRAGRRSQSARSCSSFGRVSSPGRPPMTPPHASKWEEPQGSLGSDYSSEENFGRSASARSVLLLPPQRSEDDIEDV